jgi:hypothetical protein
VSSKVEDLGQPQLEPYTEHLWLLREPFVYTTLSGCTLTVPGGFITDGASSPFGYLIEPWGGHYPAAALVHDYLYVCRNAGKPHRCAPTRKAADQLFLEIMKRSGVKPLVRLLMFAAVRIGGMSAIKGFFVR